MKFNLEAFCNPYLPEGSRRVDVILTGRGSPDENGARAGQETSAKLEFGLVIDRSGSMSDQDKMATAKRAARQMVAQIPDGVTFFIIAFNSLDHVICPATVASAESRAAADRQIAMIEASGGTIMSKALQAAALEFSTAPNTVRVCQLLTDGENDKQDIGDLDEAIQAAQGHFQCECRGVGDGWRPNELLKIANGLMGSAKAVANGPAMEQDLRETFARAYAKTAADVKIRLIVPPKAAKIVSIKQVAPEIVDLTQQIILVDDRTFDVPTGAWGSEERDFHVVFEVVMPGAIGEQVRICRTAVLIDGQIVDQPPVAVTWSADQSLTARINPEVAHYTGQVELAESIRLGMEAQEYGNIGLATQHLGRAIQIAAQSGNDEATRRLQKVVDIEDAATGTVHLRRDIKKIDALDAEVSATRTVRAGRRSTP